MLALRCPRTCDSIKSEPRPRHPGDKSNCRKMLLFTSAFCPTAFYQRYLPSFPAKALRDRCLFNMTMLGLIKELTMASLPTWLANMDGTFEFDHSLRTVQISMF
ncbi:hypothetical protein H257_19464 [Aphanomyces astaci]|uniref:Uncharacterized protein n=1 Tax=Aphanomyces astaci TaxID=112090 RepID=W4F839_APHAT|nr:hypothetical protein H257_19464 [Aphanomyces astaci]ETV63607.1 hypothetical protein H257_19464 [Aphanomyces astaci]|eukprot:XP_009846909.1 hypothetical protein H257_19464 [Aphanomyces astaci]